MFEMQTYVTGVAHKCMGAKMALKLNRHRNPAINCWRTLKLHHLKNGADHKYSVIGPNV